jgi:hypothetical protein
MDNQYDPDIDVLIENVVQSGSHYRTAEMERLYTDDQVILFVDANGTVKRAARAAMMEEFAARGAARELPLSTEYRVLHVEQQVDQAAAILFRRMSPINPAAMYELRLRKEGMAWKVAGETVMAWPTAEEGNDFLPPRSDQDRS